MLNFRNYKMYNGSGFISRAAYSDGFSESDISFLKTNNIRTIIDLRYHKEKRVERIICNDSYFQFWNLGLTNHLYADDNDYMTLIAEYIRIADQRETVKDILETIANSKGNVLYYCSWGKDRTGVISSLILMLVGMSDDVIIEDYAKSEDYYPVIISGKPSDKIPEYALHAKREYMESFLVAFREKFVDINNYCRLIGLSQENKSRIKRKFYGEDI